MSKILKPTVDRAKIRKGLDRLILGHSPHTRRGIGFAAPQNDTNPDYIAYDGEGHLATIAPTRSGKGVGTVIPNLLAYRGPVVVVDPKAEAFHVTAKRREQLGHKVIRLDPFGVVDSKTDSLNPIECLDLEHADLESDAQALAELLATPQKSIKEPFWDIHGKAIHSGLIAHTGTKESGAARSLNTVVGRLHGDDVIYALALLLDTVGKEMNEMAKREVAGVLSMPDITRGGVLATAQSYVKALMSPAVARALKPSSFSLQDILDGKPVSIYIIIPPDRMVSHRPLLKLWLATILKAILCRRQRPRLNTLILIDEAAQLGHFPLLETITTLAAGYGVWVHTIWQDLSQLRANYPDTWRTILNNCSAIQTFGIYNRDMATQWGDYFDTGPDELRRLASTEQILSLHGQGELRSRKLNYLTDPAFRGLYSANRFYPSR